MSKVRIYELAKEAGMSSKMLIDKLNEHGYEIKGASSTVEDDIADKIRTTVFQSSKAEVADKKSVAEETPVAARRTTVIRRRPTVAPEAKEVEDVPVIEGAALEDKEVQVPETLQKPVVEEFQEAEADTDVREPVAPVVVDFKEQSKDQQKDLKAAPVRHEKKAIVAEEPEPASRKGLARVVGSIEIQVEEKPPVVEKPRKRSERPAERPATGGGYSRPQPSAPKPPVNATPLSDD